MLDLTIEGGWDGRALEPHEKVRLRLGFSTDSLLIEIDAPYNGDPAPPAPAGSFDGLWNHEVVELFVQGRGQAYSEIELGPHGHHLLLRLSGPRRVIDQGLPIDFHSARHGNRWQGRAQVPVAFIPTEGPFRGNAYAIRGLGAAREHHALFPVPGAKPDFHQPSRFRELDIPRLRGPRGDGGPRFG